ncbi:MAG TPA: hypothetical protein VJU86_11300 [Pyrinomonadaceae bacterium]|nr:hypothetical protein [Pyrinomonadaceae bacterium]
MSFISLPKRTVLRPHAVSPRGVLASRHRRLLLQAAVQIMIALVFNALCFGQTSKADEKLPGPATRTVPSAAADKAPLSDDERSELLKLIRSLQERVERLEAATTSTSTPSAASPVATSTTAPNATTNVDPAVLPAPVATTAKSEQDDDEKKFYGRYTPNFGYKVANTEYGDLNVSIYTYARYLNQRGLASTYTDAFGFTKSVKERQDFQLNKVQIKFLGWIATPKLRYFLYAWTSNANQGLGAQVVLAGNLNYTFNKYVTLGVGINGLPGTRSIEGNFPFWLGVDSRHIADEFMRGSYTSGIWAKGEIAKNLKYQVMLGNNLSTLGVPASRLDNHLNTVASALVWTPTTGEFGAGFGDFEDHQKLATRLAFHFSRSDENSESQPNSEQFENTQLRLTDGTVIFTPEIFGPGVTVTDARYRMVALDGGLKYRGYALEGAYYMRWLDNFRGTATAGIPRIFNQGFQLEASAMLVPKTFQVYAGHSRVFGDQGNPWDFRAGGNFFPFKNRVVRWNNELLYLHKSPVGYTSVPFTVGGKGFVFHSSLELAF